MRSGTEGGGESQRAGESESRYDMQCTNWSQLVPIANANHICTLRIIYMFTVSHDVTPLHPLHCNTVTS